LKKSLCIHEIIIETMYPLDSNFMWTPRILILNHYGVVQPFKDPIRTLHPRITVENITRKNCNQVLIGHTYIGETHAKLHVARRCWWYITTPSGPSRHHCERLPPMIHHHEVPLQAESLTEKKASIWPKGSRGSLCSLTNKQNSPLCTNSVDHNKSEWFTVENTWCLVWPRTHQGSSEVEAKVCYACFNLWYLPRKLDLYGDGNIIRYDQQFTPMYSQPRFIAEVVACLIVTITRMRLLMYFE
jgi:hypothetical protein